MSKRYIRRVRKTYPPRGERTIVIGIDPSLTGTAVAVVADPGVVEWSHGWTDKKTLQRRHQNKLSFYKMGDKPSHADRVARIGLMSTWVLEVVKEYASTPDYKVYAAIEGLAFSQRSNRASDLAELSGVIKQGLMRLNVPFRIYDPLTLKAAWTGQGTADKSMMIMTCFRRFKIDYTQMESAGDNFADATLLAMLLFTEVELRDGRKDIKKDLDGYVRKAMLRKTKAEPVRLVDRPLICTDEVSPAQTVLGGA